MKPENVSHLSDFHSFHSVNKFNDSAETTLDYYTRCTGNKMRRPELSCFINIRGQCCIAPLPSQIVYSHVHEHKVSPHINTLFFLFLFMFKLLKPPSKLLVRAYQSPSGIYLFLKQLCDRNVNDAIYDLAHTVLECRISLVLSLDLLLPICSKCII